MIQFTEGRVLLSDVFIETPSSTPASCAISGLVGAASSVVTSSAIGDVTNVSKAFASGAVVSTAISIALYAYRSSI
jgi:hypothetical protein